MSFWPAALSPAPVYTQGYAAGVNVGMVAKGPHRPRDLPFGAVGQPCVTLARGARFGSDVESEDAGGEHAATLVLFFTLLDVLDAFLPWWIFNPGASRLPLS